ncbi:alpha-1,3-mannosyl-glycoprotein 2-beta-N-acetylglucosaminyltransferase isoform X2 [Zootermopsis nevadensis]|uniref:Alpha-1,3-mannosyl-glycoprotein 2-beta-N-acetylglucosaminyltransferase n=1 Tax=Zootermopsis nevadensis TaxID=136037 RepID=A0A067QSE6_ZOONE|nr:alpha-1,3-mannosyl-glycoprotein 2-beta-N-acetylglucosaminyltransferase isoform X2 [Zootermopsis nevadensis]KDR12543.1 Alpha-1,3-mannosyl-glycoprotein 2-beta-N-acetylglucosaminyltransferase [Zootermopsis nevadensis]
MRKNQFIGVTFVCVCLWVVVTYYLFLDRPLNHKPDQKQNQIEEHLNLLESKLKEQFLDGEKLLQDLKSIVKEQQLSVKASEDRGVGEEEQLGRQQEEEEDEQINQVRLLAKQILPDGGPVIAVLVFACNRITVSKCIDQLLKYRPSRERFPIIVSQDCGHRPTADVIELYGDEITRIEQPDQSDITVPPKEKKFKGYFKIARHYGWALNYTFFKFNFETAIIVEDDLDIAPDFFEYFLGTYPILKRDPTLWCVSAWNDNGKVGLVDENAPDLLYRTDFFPGLGWMLTKSIWAELAPKWPSSYWDDWVRQPEQRRNRACIRPEISRTRTFGKIGVSNGHFYEKHLKYIKLNEKFVPFTQKNLSYLLKDNYDVQFVKQVYESLVVSYQELKSGSIVSQGSVRIPYHTNDIYKRTAKMLGLMDDFRSGVPRTGYRGVVSFLYKGRRVYLAPNANWKGYDPGWS